MLNKIGYIIIGALLATIIYTLGSLNPINADNHTLRVKELVVEDKLTVGNGSNHTVIRKGGIYLQADHLRSITISPKPRFFFNLPHRSKIEIDDKLEPVILLRSGSEINQITAEDNQN